MAIPPRRFCIKRGGTQILPPLARIANTYRPTTMLNLARSHQLFNEHHGDARHRHDRSRWRRDCRRLAAIASRLGRILPHGYLQTIPRTPVPCRAMTFTADKGCQLTLTSTTKASNVCLIKRPLSRHDTSRLRSVTVAKLATFATSET